MPAPPRLLFCALLAACFLLRLRYGQGLAFADDFAYVNAALDANERGWFGYLTGIADIYANRVTIVLPLAVFQALFGNGELSLKLLGLCFAVGALGVCFAFARALGGEWAGWIATCLLAASPQEIWMSTSLLPDSVLPFYCGMALYATFRAQERPLDRRGLGWYALAGFFVFCAFEARATSGVLLLPLGLWGLLQPRARLVRAALPGIAFASILGGFWGLLGLASGGDYAIQLRQLVEDGTGTAWTGTGKPLQHLFWMVPILRAAAELPAVLDGVAVKEIARYAVNTYLGLHYYVVWPAAIYAAVRWRKLPAARLPLVAFASLYLFFEFGSTSLTSYQPIWKYERFLTILGVPSSVLAGVVGAHFAPRLWPRGKVLLGTAAALYVGLNGALLEANTRFWGSPVPDIKIAFERIRQSGCPETIYVVDEIWRMRGHVLLRFSPPRPHRLEVLPRGDLSGLRGACVIVDGSYFNGIAPDQLDPAAFDARLFEPARRPPTWKRLFVQKLGARDPSRSSTVEAIQLR